MSEFKRKFAAAIEATNHPLAPIILQDAHSAISHLATMLAVEPLKEETDSIINSLLSSWPDEQLDILASQPQFIIALSTLLVGAIESYRDNL